jgi:hypothetical protein
MKVHLDSQAQMHDQKIKTSLKDLEFSEGRRRGEGSLVRSARASEIKKDGFQHSQGPGSIQQYRDNMVGLLL